MLRHILGFFLNLIWVLQNPFQIHVDVLKSKRKAFKRKNDSRITESCNCISGRTVSSVFFRLICDFYVKTHTGILYIFVYQ